MRFLVKPLLLLLVALTPACQIESQEAPRIVLADTISGPESEVKAIQEAGHRLLAALQKGDLDGLMEGFTDDAVLIAQGHPILKGKPAVRTFYRSQLDRFELGEMGPSLDELVVCGDWAFSRGTIAVVGQLRNHEEKIWIFNRGIEIWKKQADGSWKIARAVGNQ